MKKTQYDGYQSFQYLKAGEDYKTYTLAKELGRVPAYTVDISDAEEARVRRLLNEGTVISLHDHAMSIPEDTSRVIEYFSAGRIHTGYEGLSQSGLDAVFDALLDGIAIITSKMGWKWTDVIHDLGMRLSDIAHQDFVVHATTVDDIRQAKANGQLAWIANLESSTPIENEIERLEVLYGLGIRCMGIVYSEANSLGSGLREPTDGGLSVFGRQCVKRMNKIGMAIDVSHAGDQTALDTIEVSDKPVFITHAGARALWPSRRLKPDEVIEACADKGGVIGIEAAPHTTLTKEHPEHSIESYMQHFEYCVDLVGVDHAAFGPDTLFGDHVGLHHAFAEHLSIAQSHKAVDYEEVEYVKGIENPAEAFPNIVRWLVKHGYSDGDIKKAIGGNTMRVLEEVWV